MSNYTKYAVIGMVIIHIIILFGLMNLKLNSFSGLKEKIFLIEFKKEKVSTEKKIKRQKIEEKKKILLQAKKEVKKLLRSALNEQVENVVEKNQKKKVEKKRIKTKTIDKSKQTIRTLEKLKINNDNNKKLQVEINENNTKKGIEVIDKEGFGRVIITLKNRYKTDMEIPVFICENGGEVFIEIKVNQAGKVIAANINSKKSTNDACLHKAAYRSAVNAIFNKDDTAPNIQKGFIQFYFAPQ